MYQTDISDSIMQGLTGTTGRTKKEPKNVKLYELKKLQSKFPSVEVTNPNEAYNFIKQFYGDDIEIYESFYILLLNTASRTIGYAKISQGGINGTVVDVRIIAKYAVDALATRVIFAHNHPTGNLKASDADKNITKKAKQALELLDIKLVDHIILSSTGYLSMSETGDM